MGRAKNMMRVVLFHEYKWVKTLSYSLSFINPPFSPEHGGLLPDGKIDQSVSDSKDLQSNLDSTILGSC